MLPKKTPEPPVHLGGAHNPLAGAGGAVITSARGGGSNSKDNDLIDSIMKRINQLESANAELRVQLKAKSTRMETLEGE